MKIVVVKYNAGNIRSVLFSLERLGVDAIVSDDVNDITTADKVIFPGVGEASSAMQYIKDKRLDVIIKNLKQPTLGICLGMQLMCNHSEEGDTECLGIFSQTVKKFPLNYLNENKERLKVPQIGWNTINNLKSHLLKGIPEESFMYFVHSYYVELGANTIATTNYGIDYSSSIQKNNFYAVQFHPEKSGDVGQQILNNFLKLC